MIVDDETISKQALKYIIYQNPNFEIISETSNGNEAFEILKTVKPDVIITDVVMPIMDGLEFSQKVNMRYPDIKIIVLSGHSKYDYIRSAFQSGAVDYILKPRLEPESLLNQLLRIAQEKGIELDESTHILTENNVLSALFCVNKVGMYNQQSFASFMKSQNYCLLGCKMRHQINNIHKLEYFVNQLNVLTKEHFKHIKHLTTTEYSDTDYIIMLQWNDADINSNQVYKTVTDFIYSSSDIFPEIFWSISSIFSDYLNSYQYINETTEKLDLSFYYYDKNFISNFYHSSKNTSPSFPHDQYSITLRSMQFDQSKTILKEFLSCVENEKCMPPNELKKLLENLLYNTFNAINDKHNEEIRAARMDFFQSMDNITNILELWPVIDTAFGVILNTYSNSIDSKQLFDNICCFIKNNHAKSITLQNIADQFHVSYNYLSACFNEYVNMGFNEYLNQCRIDEAKILLQNNNLSLAQVSQTVGYSDQSYFGKVFKKIEGISPSTYRKRKIKT